ncbi:hypothetical protein QQF64_023895 [Cirrhinus molitorella]|uniref:PiggyBac transposable element-derived protein domain-containing protein n=1 Tax=Cirrhinus molitorella TaxID=172907 RepID=A0ABR3NK34_9TELE
MSHKLFFDNWFTGINLQVQLEKLKIHSVGTVRLSRPVGCTFMEDKQIKVNGHGTFVEKQATYDNVTVRAVRWFDNCSVILLSTFAAANPVTMVERWDKKKNEVVAVTSV